MRKPSKLPNNITMRRGVYYFRKQINKKPYLRSLSTSNLGVARGRARKLEEAIKAKRFDVLELSKAKKGFANLGDIVTRYEDAAMLYGIKNRTIDCYRGCLGIVVSRGLDLHGDFMDMGSEVLGSDLVKSYASSVLDPLYKRGADPFVVSRGMRTVKSTLRQARAIFSGWVMDSYDDLLLPDLTPFLKTRPIKMVRGGDSKYILPPVDLREKTLAAGRALRYSDPRLYACFLSCYDVGMRSGDAVHFKYKWLRCEGNRFCVDIYEGDGFQPKGCGRSVPISESVYSHFMELRGNKGSESFVLGGDSRWARQELVERKFAAWMRDIGWDSFRYPKASHELRKLMGSKWFTERGPAAAQKWLGHKSVSTTCKYYADLHGDLEALPMDGLGV